MEIEAFWEANHYPQGFDQLVDELNERTIANLQNHPRMGRSFLQRQPTSVRAKASAEQLQAPLRTLNTATHTADIREYVMTDYLLLYALTGDTIDLLAIKHHKQLSFNFT